ncbi:hypothetical protein [Roseateles sp. P5_E7]
MPMHLHLPASTRRAALGLLIALCGLARAEPLHPAPHDLVGLDLTLQIEKAEGPAAGSYPSQGAIVRRVLPRGQWISHGAGGPNHRDGQGSSQWRRDGAHTLVETARDSSGQPAGSSFSYHFDTPQGGRWVWRINDGQATLVGSFTTAPSAPTAEQQLAPTTNAGLHVPLVIKAATSATVPADRYPTGGLVLQTYSPDGTLTFQGFGPGTLNSRGTYTYQRLSANTAVEETVQTSDFFVYPYTMVYTFTTPNSGTWFQNFGNGLIYFSGTFDTFTTARPPIPAR